MFATYIRNSDYAEHILYFGPMGCRTGFYLLVRDLAPQTVLALVRETLARVVAHTGPAFGATRQSRRSESEKGDYVPL